MTAEMGHHGADKWSGTERRNLDYCESHLDMVKSVAIIETTIVGLDQRINGSLKSIEKHMDQGVQWRIGIIGVAMALLIQAILLINHTSRMMKQIEINSVRLDQLEMLHPRQTEKEFE